MKLHQLCFGALLLLGLSGTAHTSQAQVTININPPSWGPAVPAGRQYYYVPEYGGYYDVRERYYIVPRNGNWVRLTSLNGYNPANFHPVVIDYVGATPWVMVREHKAKYGHPHGMPPGQAKKMRGGYYAAPAGPVIVVPGGGPGKGGGHGPGHGGGHGRGHGKH